jgi:CubicO group peptidase (beta-lactamase class C family)
MSSFAALREGPPESVGMDPVRVDRLRKLAASWIKSGDTPSLVVLVARRGMIVLHEAFGVRHYEDTTPTLMRDAIFTVASVAKPITATAVMCLVEDGLIGLNRPFIEYLPEFDVAGVPWLEEARVADLLSHTSGYDDLEVNAFIAEATKLKSTLKPPQPGQHPVTARRIQLAAGAPLTKRPGTAMIYSNFGFNLLGDIVRRVSGQPLWQFARSRIFEPLGMADSHFTLPAELRARRVYRKPGAPGTLPVPGVHTGFDSIEFDGSDFGANGLASIARDLAAFLQMLLNRGGYGDKPILSPASVAAMTRHQVDSAIPWMMSRLSPTTGKRMEVRFQGGGYGYGLFLFGPGDRFWMNGVLQSSAAFGHGGNASAYVWADPEYDLVGVYLGVAPKLIRDLPVMPVDLFQNAVYGAIVD